jgi:hypothetical protein
MWVWDKYAIKSINDQYMHLYAQKCQICKNIQKKVVYL